MCCILAKEAFVHDNKPENQAIELVATGLAIDYHSHCTTRREGHVQQGEAERGSREMGLRWEGFRHEHHGALLELKRNG